MEIVAAVLLGAMLLFGFENAMCNIGNIVTNTGAIAEQLERIADAFERQSPPKDKPDTDT